MIMMSNSFPVGSPDAGSLIDDSVACYAFDDTSGTYYIPTNPVMSGYGFNQGSGVTLGVAGKIGTCFEFNGTTDYLYMELPDDLDFKFTTESFTISWWINTTATAGFAIYKGSTTIDREFSGFHTAAGLPLFTIYDNGGTAGNNCIGTTAINDGNWHHCVCVLDGSNMYMIVDGIVEGITPITANIIHTTSDVYIGRYGGGTNYWAGKLDQLAFWSAPLSMDNTTIGSVAGGKVGKLFNGGNGLAWGIDWY